MTWTYYFDETERLWMVVLESLTGDIAHVFGLKFKEHALALCALLNSKGGWEEPYGT